MTHRIFRRIPACDPDIVRAIGESSVADLHEAMETIPGRMALLDPQIRPLNRGLRIVGQAVTAHTFPGDALVVHRALQITGPDQVLVVSTAGEVRSPMFAELVSLAARENGIAGVIADGSIRDSDALNESKFPVWCRGTYAGRTTKRGPGEINVPIVCGGVVVEPGDIIVADGDGVLRIPRGQAQEVLAGAQDRAAREKELRAAIASGDRLFDLIGLQDALAASDIVEIDDTWESTTA
ncbi:4-carboxy-4-hydroxy-2-oxoadipate aldolase/oxaloacetate decarboxylase [Rhodococcus triatomae]|nr:putative demethylmenaquinone methyltransferase [Rhodococcus triatomae BKS 15-14]